MEFYFEGLDRDGHWEAGLVHADDQKMAKVIMHENDLEPMSLRIATEEEIASEPYEKHLVGDKTLQEYAEDYEEVLLPLTDGECIMEAAGCEFHGQLSFLIQSDAQKLVFSNEAEDIFDLEDCFWELDVEEVSMVEKRGLLNKRLELHTRSGEVFVFRGKVNKADLLIRFAKCGSQLRLT